MSPPLAALAILVVAGAVLALSARDGRIALVGLLATLALAPLVAAPPPDLAVAAARIVAATLAAYLVRIPVREREATRGSRLGWPAEALAAGAAFLAGAAAHEATMPGAGPAEATAAGLAILALAAGPLFERTDALRLGLGLFLTLTGAELVRTGLSGPPSGLESIVVAFATAAVGAAVALLAAREQELEGPIDTTTAPSWGTR